MPSARFQRGARTGANQIEPQQSTGESGGRHIIYVAKSDIAEMQDLLVVSDIHGFPETYVKLLDAGSFQHHGLQLAGLSGRSDLRGDALHDHLFNQDGMRHAVRALREIDGRACLGIGFSAGGTALWNAVKEGLQLQALICVSSTRLRFETSPLDIPTMVFWGELDPYRPTESWNDAVPTCWKTYAGKQHDFYRIDALTAQSPLRSDIAEFVKGRVLFA